jgi:hypothetical protein
MTLLQRKIYIYFDYIDIFISTTQIDLQYIYHTDRSIYYRDRSILMNRYIFTISLIYIYFTDGSTIMAHIINAEKIIFTTNK